MEAAELPGYRPYGYSLLGTLDDLDHPPTLELAQGASLHDPHYVTDIAFVFLVMSHELVALLDVLPVNRVTQATLDGNGDGLVHLIAGDDADALLSEISFF
jgi:hypothetical protein